MKIHAAQGKRAGVKKHYAEMQKLFRTDLGVDPAPDTQRLFSELMK